MPQTAHIFVCYGSVSFDAALRIAEASRIPPQSLFVLCLFNANLHSWPKQAHVYSLNARAYPEWTRSFRIARWYRRILRDLESAKSGTWHVYVPHPFEIPANDLLYSNPHVERRVLLPDGMINYLPTPALPQELVGRVRYCLRVFLKVLAAAAVGLRYRPLLSGSLTQAESFPYDSAWAPSTMGFRAPPCGVTRLPQNDMGPPAEERHAALFLDQELSELVNPSLESALRARLHELLEELDGEVYYRAHPRGIDRSKSFPFTENVSQAVSAEEVLHSLPIATLIGFYSTPLLFHQEGVRRIAVLPPPDASGVRKRRLLADLREALSSSGVEVLSIAIADSRTGPPSWHM